MNHFKIIAPHKPAGDQPNAIRALVSGLEKGMRHQTLLGVTGSGKTFTIANVIERVQKPTLVIAHNKTLAAQLCNEFRELFPENAVHYFVSYYDYYQPEAYLPRTDTYIDKEALINDEIDKLRHAATSALLTRRDVIVVASVSCIYGLGAPEVYAQNIFHFKVGDAIDRSAFARKLVELQFTRTNVNLKRGTFRLRGDTWEIMPPDRELIYHLEMESPPEASNTQKTIKHIFEVDPVKGFQPGKTPTIPELYIAPAKHFITPKEDRERAILAIQKELKEQLKYFEEKKLLLEAERLERRTKFDIAMMREVGYCHGVENYSRHLSGRTAGEPPDTLLDYFPKQEDGTPDFLTVIDESHVTVPQLEGMHAGDASRKKTLIEYGFRLPSAADNRPLKFKEFEERVARTIYTSATPAIYEKTKSSQIVEQIIRPTGLVDPVLTMRPARGQIDDLIPRIEERVAKGERVLVTTLTKKMAEDLTAFLSERGAKRKAPARTTPARQSHSGREVIQPARVDQSDGSGKQSAKRKDDLRLATGDLPRLKVAYLHSDVKTLDRIRILTELRRGKIEVLVGVNLLREGLDLPEVSLVAILDADKEGFLRSETSLIQTIGRAARNVNGEVLIYADHVTGSIKRAVGETERRRALQIAYNTAHGITPQTIIKTIRDILPTSTEEMRRAEKLLAFEAKPIPHTKKALEALIKDKEREMREAAAALEFELAALLRDEIRALRHRKS